MSKKDIYSEYGIQYKNDKILSPLGWIPELLTIGTNTKVGAAATYSQWHGNNVLSKEAFGEKVQAIMETAGIDEIKGSCPCHCPECYCDKGRYNYDSNKASAIRKLLLVRICPEFVEKAITVQIKADGIEQCRIHAQGDFDSNRNCDIWVNVANNCPDTLFWTYTKSEYALKVFRKIRNIKITPSITPYGFNFGTCSEILDLYRKLTNDGYRVHVCACGTKYQKHCSECNHGCKAIETECDYVLFIQHSGKYKAGKDDPDDFAKVCDIIAGQEN